MEEAVEDEGEAWAVGALPTRLESKDSYESEPGLGDSKWETSPTRGVAKEAEDEEEGEDTSGGGGGVLGLLYQFQKAQTEGRPGINI